MISGQPLLVERTTGRHTWGRRRPIDAIRGGHRRGLRRAQGHWQGSGRSSSTSVEGPSQTPDLPPLRGGHGCDLAPKEARNASTRTSVSPFFNQFPNHRGARGPRVGLCSTTPCVRTVAAAPIRFRPHLHTSAPFEPPPRRPPFPAPQPPPLCHTSSPISLSPSTTDGFTPALVPRVPTLDRLLLWAVLW